MLAGRKPVETYLAPRGGGPKHSDVRRSASKLHARMRGGEFDEWRLILANSYEQDQFGLAHGIFSSA
jgi:hypothetical protein